MKYLKEKYGKIPKQLVEKDIVLLSKDYWKTNSKGAGAFGRLQRLQCNGHQIFLIFLWPRFQLNG